MSESTQVKHDASCPYGDEFSLTAPDQCAPCALIRKTRDECAEVVDSFDWSPETDDADVKRLIATLRGTE